MQERKTRMTHVISPAALQEAHRGHRVRARSASTASTKINPDPKLTFEGEPLRGHLTALMVGLAQKSAPGYVVDRIDARFFHRIGCAPLQVSLEVHARDDQSVGCEIQLFSRGKWSGSASIRVRQEGADGTEHLPQAGEPPKNALILRPAPDRPFESSFFIRDGSLPNQPLGYIRTTKVGAIDPGGAATLIDAFLAAGEVGPPRIRRLRLQYLRTLPDPGLDPHHFVTVACDPPANDLPSDSQVGVLWSHEGRALARFERVTR